MSVPIPAHTCANCFHLSDRAGEIDRDSEAVPKEDDFNICLYCGQINVYRADQTLRKVTQQELAEFAAEYPEDYIKMMKAVAYIMKRNKQN